MISRQLSIFPTTATNKYIARRTPHDALTLKRLAPPRAPREHHATKPLDRPIGARTIAVPEPRPPPQRDVVDAVIPQTRVHDPVAARGHDGADDGAGDDVVGVVVLAHDQGAAQEGGGEDGDVGQDEDEVGRLVVGEELELGVQVDGQSGMGRSAGLKTGPREKQERVVVVVVVAVGNTPIKSGSLKPNTHRGRNVGPTDGQEMGAQAANDGLDDDLKGSGGQERVDEAEEGVVGVPEGARAPGGHDKGDGGGAQGAEQAGGQRGEDGGDIGVRDRRVQHTARRRIQEEEVAVRERRADVELFARVSWGTIQIYGLTHPDRRAGDDQQHRQVGPGLGQPGGEAGPGHVSAAGALLDVVRFLLVDEVHGACKNAFYLGKRSLRGRRRRSDPAGF
ncbi:hypothetical protein GP486_007037 [Trichoglossum hirsutum]|uniref:Uncharacterized protein n=1 Tax=Trichoglossum hirsutum TaxID=265104 RepID=A0A9P8L741_9PEZI|nr:hypothetical protein GP486_007037 [Trichoglossum hirsutum]